MVGADRCEVVDSVLNTSHFVEQKVKLELMNLEKQLGTAKKQLEEETITRVDLENRVQSLKEELAFKNQVHETVSVLVLVGGLAVDLQV